MTFFTPQSQHRWHSQYAFLEIGPFRFPELGTMIPDPRYWPALIGSLLVDLLAMGGPFKVWPMKAASVLFGCVDVAGSAQEEDEVCEDILQRNVVLITPFGSSGIPPPY